MSDSVLCSSNHSLNSRPRGGARVAALQAHVGQLHALSRCSGQPQPGGPPAPRQPTGRRCSGCVPWQTLGSREKGSSRANNFVWFSHLWCSRVFWFPVLLPQSLRVVDFSKIMKWQSEDVRSRRIHRGETAEVPGEVTTLTNLLLPCFVQLVNDGTSLQGELLTLLLR